MVLIYQVLTRQCLKKVFLTSNDFVPNDSSLLNSLAGVTGWYTAVFLPQRRSWTRARPKPPAILANTPVTIVVFMARIDHKWMWKYDWNTSTESLNCRGVISQFYNIRPQENTLSNKLTQSLNMDLHVK